MQQPMQENGMGGEEPMKQRENEIFCAVYVVVALQFIMGIIN